MTSHTLSSNSNWVFLILKSFDFIIVGMISFNNKVLCTQCFQNLMDSVDNFYFNSQQYAATLNHQCYVKFNCGVFLHNLTTRTFNINYDYYININVNNNNIYSIVCSVKFIFSWKMFLFIFLVFLCRFIYTHRSDIREKRSTTKAFIKTLNVILNNRYSRFFYRIFFLSVTCVHPFT